MSWIWVVIVALFGFGSLSGPPPPPSPPSPPEVESASLVVQWSQGRGDEVPLDVPSQVLATEADRDAFLAGLPASLDVEAVEDVDLGTSVLVVGGYSSCQQSSYVATTPDGLGLGVTETPDNLACEWSPYTVDVWAVAR